MLRPYKTFSEKVSSLTVETIILNLSNETNFINLKDKEIYRWPIKESIKAMLAWEWNIEKAREEEESEKKKTTARKISQTAQVPTINKILHIFNALSALFILFPFMSQATYDPSHGYSPQPIDISHMALSRDLQVCQ